MLVTADFSDAVLVKISKHIGHERRRLATLLGLRQSQIDQIEQDHRGDSRQINLAILQVPEFECSSMLFLCANNTVAYQYTHETQCWLKIVYDGPCVSGIIGRFAPNYNRKLCVF